jgi:hypothetical protein
MDDNETSRSFHHSDKLTSTNYGTWKLKMQMVSQIRDLWEIVDGEQKLSDPQWMKKSEKTKAIIGLNLLNAQLQHIRKCSTAKEVWTTLEKVHQGNNLMRRIQLHKEFFNIKKNQGESIQSYVSRVNELRELLESIGDETQELHCVLALLAGLPEDYAPLVMALEARGEDLQMETVISLLLTEEQRRSNNDVGEHQEKAFFSKERRTKPMGARPMKGKKGNCHNCGRPGHWARDCRLPRKNESSVAAAHDSEYAFASVSERQPVEFTDAWILDTGATKHMTGKQEWLRESESVHQPIKFGLSSGIAKKKGVITVSN